MLAYASFRIAEDLVGDAESFLGISEARAQAEVGSGADVARAEAALARARETAARARGRWEQASVRLAVLLRWNPQQLLLPADEELRPLALLDPDRRQELLDETETARPDLHAAHARAQAASIRTTAEWWELLGPELQAGFRERFIGTRIDDLDNTTLAHALVGFSFDFGELGRLRTARGEARAAAIREQALHEQVRGQIDVALSQVRAAGAAIPHAQAGMAAAEQSYRIELDRFKAGTGLGLEVNEAQNARARARLALAEVIVRYNVAQIELASSIGHFASQLVRAHPGSAEK